MPPVQPPAPNPSARGRDIDIRSLGGSVKIRANTDGSGGSTAYGYIARFNVESEVLMEGWGDPFVEIIAPGAFANTIASGKDVLALVAHDYGKPLARMSTGGLKLWEDAEGLAYECRLPDVSYARDIVVLINDGVTPGNSFGFFLKPGGDSISRVGDTLVRTLFDVDLDEVSISVVNPAYSSGTVSAIRSLQSSGTPQPPKVGTPKRNLARHKLRFYRHRHGVV